MCPSSFGLPSAASSASYRRASVLGAPSGQASVMGLLQDEWRLYDEGSSPEFRHHPSCALCHAPLLIHRLTLAAAFPARHWRHLRFARTDKEGTGLNDRLG